MKTTLAITLCLSVGLCPNSQSASPPQFQIADRALATLKVPGFPDFLAADGNAVWVTNENRVEKLVFESKGAVMTVHVPEPCGAMIVAFNSLWVASCRDKSIYRVDKHFRGNSWQNCHGTGRPRGRAQHCGGRRLDLADE
jgi:virginiamycin B lyase